MPTISKFAAYHTPITTGYTNPSNAYADDGVYATAAPGRNAQVSAYFGFPAFASDEIPDGAIINSVTTEFEYHVSTTASIAIQYWQTFVGTTGLGTEQSDDTEPLMDVVKTHTVTSGITLSDLRTANKVRMRLRSARGNSNTAVTFYIDYVKITIDYTPAVLGSANLTGLGSLSVAGILMKIGNAALTGIGTFTTTAIKTIFSQASLVGQGTLSAIGSILKQGAAILSGTGSLIAQGAKIIVGQANLIGQGLLSAAGEVISEAFVYGSAVLTGIGQLVASGTKIVLGQANLSGIGSLVSSAIKIIIGQANLIGNGLLSAAGTLIKIGEVVLSGVGSLISSAIKIIFGSASLVGQGFLFAAGFIPSAAKAIKNIILSKFVRFWD
jgi:hypothetical protein